MTPLERAARALARFSVRDESQFPYISKSEAERSWPAFLPQARAVLQAIREPISAWLAHQIEHGHAPDGYPVEMTPEYTLGRISAFQATKAMIDAALEEG
jgi:hypothetical protein